jgi:hypothetical protein
MASIRAATRADTSSGSGWTAFMALPFRISGPLRKDVADCGHFKEQLAASPKARNPAGIGFVFQPKPRQAQFAGQLMERCKDHDFSSKKKASLAFYRRGKGKFG